MWAWFGRLFRRKQTYAIDVESSPIVSEIVPVYDRPCKGCGYPSGSGTCWSCELWKNIITNTRAEKERGLADFSDDDPENTPGNPLQRTRVQPVEQRNELLGATDGKENSATRR